MNATQPLADREPVGEHVFSTYFSLRMGLGYLAVALPPALYLVGRLHGIGLQPSMSAYFFAVADAAHCASFPLRTILVGMLCAICAGLYLYKGFGRFENYLLNAAAVCGVVVAVVPERLGDAPVEACRALQPIQLAQQGQWPLHYMAAVSMFVCLAVVVWFCARKTLALLPPAHAHRAPRFARIYKVLALLMLVFPLVGLALSAISYANSKVFFIEAAGVWTFGAYWFVKSREMALSRLEQRALKGAAEPSGGSLPSSGAAQPSGA